MKINLNLTGKAFFYKAAFLLLAVLFCTYLRVSLLLIYPLIVVGLYYILHWKLDKNALYLFGWVLLCWLLSFRHGFYLPYNLVSFYFFVPFLLLLFAVPPVAGQGINHLKLLMSALTFVALLNDIPGIIQYSRKLNDDSFVGIYGIFTVSQNGLSLLNAVVFFYHFLNYQHTKKSIHLILAFFFITCCVMGFYGAGQMVFIASLALTYFRIKAKNLLRLLLVCCLALGTVVLLMRMISPHTLRYNVAIIKKFVSPANAQDIPRKITVFRNYFEAYTAHPIDLLLGSGPGTFNSRSSFMVGSPYYFYLPQIKSTSKPYFFEHYAYTLWNNTNTGPYDGFMNQPFTTILALLGEYGLIFCALLFFVLFSRFKYYNRAVSTRAKSLGVTVEARMYSFCTIFAFSLIIIDNYMEYPEIIGLLLIIIKLSQQQLGKALNV